MRSKTAALALDPERNFTHAAHALGLFYVKGLHAIWIGTGV